MQVHAFARPLVPNRREVGHADLLIRWEAGMIITPELDRFIRIKGVHPPWAKTWVLVSGQEQTQFLFARQYAVFHGNDGSPIKQAVQREQRAVLLDLRQDCVGIESVISAA